MNPGSAKSVTTTATEQQHREQRLPMVGRMLIERLNRVGLSALTLETPDGSRYAIGNDHTGELPPRLVIHDWKVLRRGFRAGLLGWAEGYMAAEWSCDPLQQLTDWAMNNEAGLSKAMGNHWSVKALNRALHLLRSNSRRGSRRNISFHYDLGNDFYRLWLDPTMTYSSALFNAADESLQQGQANKYQQIIDWLNAGRPDSGSDNPQRSDAGKEPLSVAEIGCGWGGFAAQFLDQQRADYRGITLSHEQLEWCQQRSWSGETRPHFSLTDYRDLEGEYDGIVSIEMLEAVGEEHWPEYFSRLQQRLKPGATAVIQVITIDDQRFQSYRRSVDFIQKYIFPGGMLMAPAAMRDQVTQAGLRIEEELGFGQDYATTLQHWRERFDAAWPQIEQLGYDQRFRRMWRYYLCYCESGFKAGSIDVRLYRLKKPALCAAR